MRNIPRITFTLVLIIVATSLFAQNSRYDEITGKRIQYISERLELTPTESEKLWPVFREFYNRREQISQSLKLKNEQDKGRQLITEQDYLDAIQQLIELKIKQSELVKEFNQKYLNILSAKQVYKLYQLDDEFNKRLLAQLKKSPQHKNERPKK